MSSVIALPNDVNERSLSRLLRRRRSTKHFAAQALDLPRVAAVLWAALGSTADGHRVIPSARAAYPVAATLVAGNVTGLRPGAYHYSPVEHTLVVGASGDHRPAVADVTLDATYWLPECTALLLLSADLKRASRQFADQPADRSERFVWLETGHISQNVYLWAVENGLGAVLVAGIDHALVPSGIGTIIPDQHQLLGIMGLGIPAGLDPSV